MTDDQIFRYRASRSEFRSNTTQRRQWSKVLDTLYAISGLYGITPEEFDYYLTIQSPNGRARVFYPYHIFSRRQAKAANWDWDALNTVAKYMIEKKTKRCNLPAENAGLGEKETTYMVICWLCAFFSKKIAMLRDTILATRPDADCQDPAIRLEIAISNLDRWGLPVVPFMHHALAASLCKEPDHGIAMFYGFTSQSAESFNPLADIDLDQCTVTIDAAITNATMLDYPPSSWDSIRNLWHLIHHMRQLHYVALGSEDGDSADGGSDIDPNQDDIDEEYWDEEKWKPQAATRRSTMRSFGNLQSRLGLLGLLAANIVGTTAAFGSRSGPASNAAGTLEACFCNKTTAKLPEGAWDSHFHVIDPIRFPPVPNAAYQPGTYTVWQNSIFEHSIGCDQVVMVQPSIYGTDNRLLVDSLKAYGPARARGVVVFDVENTTTVQLAEWNSIGVRGVRINLQSINATESVDELERTLRVHADAVKPFNWVLQLYAPMELIPSIEAFVPTLGVRVVFDHFGDPKMPAPTGDPQKLDPYSISGFAAMVRLLQQGHTWVKISAAYRVSKLPGPNYSDTDPLARELFRAAPSRVVYASDWPHTRFEGLDIRPWNAHLLDMVGTNLDLKRRLFRDNALELWSG
ncbi:tim barrel metal-dependent protein [Purpureocillium lavendulum]|uniref:Tim barrel metal-dependent protein n=1 Tax=Purpureocillium lavendulum TaxID=1247861 RepID=A0AB34FQR5_9HYPO|nr:tim barrel metal-dependent protein [Purpureocillium lavendulum]